jgi:hypothetical protein
MVTGYGPDGRRIGVRVPAGDIFLFPTPSRPILGLIQPPIEWIPGALSPGVKRMGCKSDHSPPTSAEAKNAWIYTSTSPYAFMATGTTNRLLQEDHPTPNRPWELLRCIKRPKGEDALLHSSTANVYNAWDFMILMPA